MTLATFKLYSPSLNKQTHLNIYLPAKPISPQPVLFLLHGLSDNETSWLDMTSLALFASKYSFAIVMPDAGRSYYNKLATGENYWDYLTNDLPKFLKMWFNWSLEKTTTFVAGDSMGGYGAFKLALNYPDRFGAAASLSGRLDINGSWADRPEFFQSVFGPREEFINSNGNLLNLVANPKLERLPLFQLIGTNDDLIENNRAFRAFARPYLHRLEYHEQTGGHDWTFWDTYLPAILSWFNEQYQQLNTESDGAIKGR